MSEEKQLSEKEKRQMECMSEIREVLKKHNCTIQPLVIMGPGGEKAQFTIQADVACIAMSSILEGVPTP